MHHVERGDGSSLVPIFALALFAGIRPSVGHGEILKLQADPVRLDSGVTLIKTAGGAATLRLTWHASRRNGLWGFWSYRNRTSWVPALHVNRHSCLGGWRFCRNRTFWGKDSLECS